MDLSLINYAWAIFAGLFSFFTIINWLAGEFFPGNMLRFVFLMRLFTFIGSLPVLVILPWPDDPVFYISVVIGCCIFAYTDLVYYGLVSRDGSGVVSRMEPVSSWFLFFVWTLISPALLFSYIENPVRLVGIVLSLTGCVYFALRLRQCEISWSVLKRIFPAILLGVIGVSSSKIAMDASPLHSGIWYYVLLQSGVMVLIYSILFRLKTIPTLGDLDIAERDIPQKLFTRRAVMFALLAVLGMLTAQPLKYYAISLAENPAYVTVFALLSPFWILLVYKALGRREGADILSGLGIVVCTAIMVMFTQF